MKGNAALQQQLFLRAAAEGKIDLCSRIIASLAESKTINTLILDAHDQSGSTPLMLAARFGHADIVEILLLAGANPEAQSRFGNTAIHWACMGGHLSIVQHLEHAQPMLLTCRNANGDSPLMWASSAGHDAIVAFIIGAAPAEKRHCNHEGINAIMCAAMGGYASIVERLLQGEDNALINAQDANGNTALHLAVRGQHAACVCALLALDPDLHQTDRKGLAVLDLARLPNNGFECRAVIEAHLDERRRACAALESQLLRDEETAGAVSITALEAALSGHQLPDTKTMENPSPEASDGSERRLDQCIAGHETPHTHSVISDEPSNYCRVQNALDELVGDAGRELGLVPEHMLGLDLDHLSASQLDAVLQALKQVAARIRSVRRRLEQQAVLDLGAQVVTLTARLDRLTRCLFENYS